MKKIIISIALSVALIAIFVVIVSTKKQSSSAKANTDFLRIHIRANSNESKDQNVKYLVKEKVVEYLSPLIINCINMNEAAEITQKNLSKICEIANNVLQENGFSYTCKAQIRDEDFPTRSYGELTLESGRYHALVLELGTGEGNNWWCVMFPPLCFLHKGENSDQIKYESKIWNLIKKYS